MGIGATPVARDESYAATPRAVSNPGRGFASTGGATPQSVPAGGPLPWSIHQARMTASRGELRDAVATRDVEGARRSLTDLRQHQDEALIAGSAGQPVESRLCAPAVRTMYRKAASQVEEGLADGDDAKVRLGLEHMDEGDRSLKSIRRN